MSAPHADEPADRAPGETRIGPMVWVPELREREGRDPWAHRKGEPRYFALYWTLYLLGSALLTVLSIRSVGIPTQEQFILGGRGMVLMCALGVVPLWPMVRLSQASAPNPLRASALDAGILLVPSWAVIVPISFLTGWTLGVSAALCVALFVWAFVTGGVVALGQQRESRLWRLGAMALAWALPFVGMFVSWGGTVFDLWGASSEWPARLGLMSPVSSVFVLTTPAEGAVLAFGLPDGAWVWILLPMLAGAAAWAIARAVAPRSTGHAG